jgi:hypothetical protein
MQVHSALPQTGKESSGFFDWPFQFAKHSQHCLTPSPASALPQALTPIRALRICLLSPAQHAFEKARQLAACRTFIREACKCIQMPGGHASLTEKGSHSSRVNGRQLLSNMTKGLLKRVSNKAATLQRQ